MKRIFLAASILLGLATPVSAQTQPGTATVVATCGSGVTYTSGRAYPITQNTAGQSCDASTSTPSGTQDVNVTKVNGNTALAGAGVAGTGSLRTTTAQDTTTIAGSAPGTAGTASANVVTVQGIASGTALAVSGTITAVTTVGTITNPVGIKGADGSTIASTSNPVPTQGLAATSGGANVMCQSQIKATATACGTAAAHQVYLFDISNANNTAISYFQVFDVAVGSVTLGTTVPNMTFEIPAAGHVVVPIAIGLAFSNQITVACTTAATGAVAPTNNCSYNIVVK